MKSKKILSVLLILLTVALVFGSCSSSSKAGAEIGVNSSESVSDGGDILKDESSFENGGVSSNRKIIERINLTVQTKDFEGFIEKVKDETDGLGGYVESSSVDGKSYSSYNNNRRAKLIIRVPSENDKEFTDFLSENSYVSHEEITTEDVTLSYVDMQSRLSALETERETLEKLLASAENLSDVIAIQDKLTEVIYEIESYESKLRTYDNLIEYTTVTLTVVEVETEAVDEYDSIWHEIGTNLKENFKDVGNILERAFVISLSAIPYILMIAVPAVIIGVLVKIALNLRKKSRNKSKDDDNKQ